ncbi:carbohydrate ABC transporter substrate-binding protein (CUT1 family) [Actinoplanes italicus]|uniref:Carbohydrate ABC transporter substrate-binding protein (CUT1 family) n=1 Tax=Actinoplanes italicus TaxID=113567 RepID=A0A2T0KDK9_9ACTN|nr:carbohydrate ABC transporter substrate-binding protein (CUT1 family) [Actinoplanes italicus]
MNIGNFSARRVSRRSVVAAVAATALALTGCSSGGDDDKPAEKPTGTVTVKVWAWYPEFKAVVDQFNATHTDVKIEWTNAGTGQDQYTKLQTALKAGKGAPDVVMLELQEIPTFALTKHLVDLGKYGANDVKGDYAGWAWSQVSSGEQVYAIPVDAGPMAMMYRDDIFKKYNLTVPTTWDEYKAQAEKLKAASGGKSFMTDFGANDGGFMTGLFWQAGAKPYTYDIANPSSIGVNVNSAEAKKVFEYWEGMVNNGLADTTAFHTTDFYNGLGSEKYATYLAAGWGPGYIQANAGGAAGKWKVAPLPQWTAGANAQGDWGGSSFAVTDQAKYPDIAAKVAIEIFGAKNTEAWKIGIDKAFLFPTVTPVLESDAFTGKTYDFFGGQKVNEVFVPAYSAIGELDWSPFNSYNFNQLTTNLGQAIEKKTSWTASLDAAQENIKTYATQQGFKVQ